MFKTIKQGFFGLLAVVAVAAVIGTMFFLMLKPLIAAGPQVQPPSSVAAGVVREDQWESVIPAVGTVVAVQGITVSTEVEGVVRAIKFDAGAKVKAGDVLVELDTDVEQSQLRSAEAAAELAQANARRSHELFASHTISQAELDAAEAARKQAAAAADNIRAVIAKKHIRAPFDGRLGIRQISLGQFLNKGEAIVSLQSLDPVYVEFSLPQRNLGELQEGLVVRATSDAFGGEAVEGRLTALNPNLDPSTRNVRIQATFKNANTELRPGMFVDVDVVLPQKRDVLIVPSTAVLHAPYGDSVFVIEQGPAGADGAKTYTVRQATVRTGDAKGDFVVVTSGLKAGERIVTQGAFKLQNGAAVVISDLGVPVPSLNPHPSEG